MKKLRKKRWIKNLINNKQEVHGPRRSHEKPEKKIKNFVNVFSLIHNYLPLEIKKGLNPDHPRMLCAKFS